MTTSFIRPNAARTRVAALPAAVALAFAIAPFAAVGSTTLAVTTCDDPLPVATTCAGAVDGTLRRGFLCAQNSDVIDLSALSCSKITLQAPLRAGALSLDVVGPGRERLTIRAGGAFRVIEHGGRPYDSLAINGVTLADGRYVNPGTGTSGGGCIFSTGIVELNDSAMSYCATSATTADAGGGAIFAATVGLYRSTISNSSVRVGEHHRAYGGAVFARGGGAYLTQSTITGSSVGGAGIDLAAGGGVEAYAVSLDHTTISGNTATYEVSGRAIGGGISAYSVTANYSTISDNVAASGAGAVSARFVFLGNSTVADNRTGNGPVGGIHAYYEARVRSSTITGNNGTGGFAAGLYGGFGASPTSVVQDTIIANNRAGIALLDIGVAVGQVVHGSNNLVTAAAAGTVPLDTIFADPGLGPLRDNGGPTRTRAPLAGSPAIDKGLPSPGGRFDQSGDARVIGPRSDIGAVEFDPDRIFTSGFNF